MIEGHCLINVSALRTSLLVVNLIAKVKKPLTLDEELILPVVRVICCELFSTECSSKGGMFLFWLALELDELME